MSNTHKGKVLSLETRQRISQSRKGQIPWIKGKHHSEETKAKMSKTAKGREFSEEHKKNLSLNNSRCWLGKHHSLETREKLSRLHRGMSNYRWKGGITSLKRRIQKGLKNKLWRSDIFLRDNFTCQHCKERGGYLHAHHLKSFAVLLQVNNIQTVEQAEECESLWDRNNGMTLCEKCHKKLHGLYKRSRHEQDVIFTFQTESV